MAYRLSKFIESRYPIPLDVKYYVCTSEADVANLPRVYVDGTADEKLDKAPCWYGSEAIVSDGTSSSVYILNANNVWTKL